MIFFSEFDGSKKNEYNFFKLPKDIQIISMQSMSNFFRKSIGKGWGKWITAIKANGLQD